ncbi:DUF4136 domain-containing protein [Flavicella marina]|uniref:DUF4136 domain-containing protein n=1 Tax=Flavicella marina TaxID=1475951 RepID=UPI001263EC53|nr:DUF4136 domain-containing protein [Flavicella marina]
MKKTMQLVGLVFALAILNSCYRSPDLSQLSYDFVVATDVDLEADFTDYDKYYLSDTIFLFSNTIKDDSIIVPPASDPIINEIVANMNNRGYTRTVDPTLSDADIAIATTIIKAKNTGTNCWGWWGGYPGYYPPWGWYPGGGYYYPYCSTYNYNTGDLLIEFGDFKNSAPGMRINTIWNAVSFGVLSTYETTNINRAVDAIEQAFIQSPYIQK